MSDARAATIAAALAARAITPRVSIDAGRNAADANADAATMHDEPVATAPPIAATAASAAAKAVATAAATQPCGSCGGTQTCRVVAGRTLLAGTCFYSCDACFAFAWHRSDAATAAATTAATAAATTTADRAAVDAAPMDAPMHEAAPADAERAQADAATHVSRTTARDAPAMPTARPLDLVRALYVHPRARVCMDMRTCAFVYSVCMCVRVGVCGTH